jgi:preprotein translocase subunit SecG
MYYLFFGIHLLISFLIVVVVLLQRSKGGGLSGAFGGVGAGDAAFGSVGVTTFLHKTTIYLAIGFMITSLSLAYMTAMRSEAVPTGPTGGGGETVLPVGDTPVMPEQPAGAAGDTMILDDEIVPQGDETVVPPADADTSIVPEEGSPGQGGGR